jgi:hypothetical protein
VDFKFGELPLSEETRLVTVIMMLLTRRLDLNGTKSDKNLQSYAMRTSYFCSLLNIIKEIK